MSRQTTSRVLELEADCAGCPWSSNASNAMGNAARHHDATGHAVKVTVAREVIYGDPLAPIPGQQALDVEQEEATP